MIYIAFILAHHIRTSQLTYSKNKTTGTLLITLETNHSYFINKDKKLNYVISRCMILTIYLM